MSHRFRGMLVVCVLVAGCERGAPPSQPAPAAAAGEPVDGIPVHEHNDPDTVITLDEAQLAGTGIRSTRRDLFITSETIPERSFSTIKGIDVDSYGNIYVLDLLAFEVRVFAADGQFIRKFGRKGGGPGEFLNPRSLVLHNDTVIVLDNSLVMFDTAGSYVRSVATTPDPQDVWRASRVVSLDTGIAVFIMGRDTLSRAEIPDTVNMRNVDLTTGAIGPPRINTLVQTMSYSNGVVAPYPLESGEHIAVSRSGRIFHSYGDSLHIDVTDRAGVLRAVIEGSAARVPIADAEIEMAADGQNQVVQRMLPQGVQGIDLSGTLQAFRDSVRLTKRPVVGQLIASRKGSLLVKRIDVTKDAYDASRRSDKWLLLSSTFVPFGHIELPASFQPHVLDECSVLGVLRGEDDVSAVARYRIGKTGPGGTLNCMD